MHLRLSRAGGTVTARRTLENIYSRILSDAGFLDRGVPDLTISTPRCRRTPFPDDQRVGEVRLFADHKRLSVDIGCRSTLEQQVRHFQG
jgi:hypothetical protein